MVLALARPATAEDASGRMAGMPVQVAQALGEGAISRIRVDGTQRIDPSTVESYLTVSRGDRFDPGKLDESLKALFGTGLFADVVLRREGGTLVVVIKENPIINRIAFEGNKRVKDEQLNAEVRLRPRVVFTRSKVQSDTQRLQDLYRRNGRFAAKIEPKVIELDQNRVDLVFEIEEGPRTGVRRVNFVGNRTYSDGTLREKIQTKESRWYRFLTSDDSYDPDRVAYDRELLSRFYLSEGYADFRVASAVAELTPDQEEFIVTYTVEEGERYQFGPIGITTSLKNLDTEALRSRLTTQEGDWYDADAVEKSIQILTEAVGDLQYAFVDVRPRVERDREKLTIKLTYDINEGPRVFVEKIDITGNVRTVDKVIRREMRLVEGDPFNSSKVKQSEQRIRDLGYFERVNVAVAEGSQPDLSAVEVEVTEQSTGEISFGAGFSTTDGPLADFSIRERNLLGRGQDLRVGATVSGKRQEYDISFTEPYFLERDLSAGGDLFRISRDNQKESSYDETATGMGLRMGYPLTEHLRHRLSYRLAETEITNVESSASRFIREQEGSRLVSEVGHELLYDTRNSKFNPNRGYYIRLRNEAAGLGGNAKYVRSRVGTGVHFPITDQWTFTASGEVGYIFGVGQDLNIADRFFIGGDTLRGFAVAGVGPRDLSTKDALGGAQYARATVEASFPLGLPSEFDVLGHVFTDAGSLAGLDRKDPVIVDAHALRVASGVGVSWRSPFGPIRLDLAVPFMKESYDKKEQFRFSFGTRF